MKQYILKRFLFMALSLFGLMTITFIISRVAPGDPAALAAGPDASHDMVEVIRKEFGLDKPVIVQYFNYIKGLLQGDLGRSIRTRRLVIDDLIRFFPATFELTVFSLFLAVILGVPSGVLCAVYRDRFPDHAARIFSVSGLAMPMFWLALMLQLVFALRFDVLPVGGRIDMLSELPPKITHLYLLDSIITGKWSIFWDALKHIMLPAVVLCFPALASIIRVNRADMIEVLNKDYIINARAQGISKFHIISQYALKNAMIPTMTMIGLRYGWMLGGTILVETVFDWPGIGLYAVQSAVSSDFQPIMGATLLIGLNFMVANLIVDLVYGVLDPRVRYD
ncbi:MAG: ABC transporter permease [Deltaproteobacteria bacterium]|nr:ABC transporter permease [Deltaproteobacteria bacterium]MBW2152894.1 ABC transporter permease [Deltaproteobacteria bacterium]